MTPWDRISAVIAREFHSGALPRTGAGFVVGTIALTNRTLGAQRGRAIRALNCRSELSTWENL
jgi:hypothetical protein